MPCSRQYSARVTLRCLSCDIPLRLLGLTTTNTFTFIFDFAYCHRFSLTLLDINPPSKNLTRAILTSHGGKTLHQYPGTGNPPLAALTEEPPKVLKLVRPTHAWRARFIRTADRNTLIQWRKSNDKRLWQKAVTVLESWKCPPEEIAQKIEKGVDAVQNWLKIFNRDGIAGLKAVRKVYSNATQRRTVREQKRQRILEIVHDRPHSFGISRSNWNLSSLALAYSQKYDEKISRSTASRFLRQSDYRMKKARKVLSSPDPKYRDKVELLLQTLHTLKGDELFFFVDELGPLRVKTYGGRMFMGKTERCSIPQVQHDRGAVTMAGALSATTNQMTWLYGPSKSTSTMIHLLEILFNQHYSVARLYITWDAASWHRSGALVEWLDAFNEKTRQGRAGPLICLVPLPTCSQFLDVIEAVFGGMKKAVIHHSNYASEIDMKTAISRHFLERNAYFLYNPKRAGQKIWELDFFADYDNMRYGNYRKW
jgi:transposase